MAREMKDSGIEWIGEMPIDWGITSLKHLCKMRAGKTLTSEQISQEGRYPVYGGNGIRGFYEEFNNEGTYLLVGRQGALCGNVHKVEGRFWATEHAVIVCINNNCDIDYMYYILVGLNLNQYASNTAAQPGLAVNTILNVKTCIVQRGEQKKIALFLSRKCAELDHVLEKTRASIEEYKKLKQAVITQAVTQGIRGNREMKDSGVEWIGNIPIGWELVPFRHVLKERQEKNSPIKSKERLSLSIDLGVTLYADKTTNLDRYKDDFEQYKLACEGDLVMNSMNMIVGATGVSDYFGCVSPVYYTFYDELEDHVTAKYCEYIFRSKTMLRVLYSLGKGIYAIVRGDDRVNTCRLKVSKEDLKSIIIPVPPVEEQREIVNYLKKKCLAIDELIAKKEQYLSEIENYKKSLIYEYVTGKKVVPQNC